MAITKENNMTTTASVTIRKLTADDHHYAEMQLTNGKHLKWLSKTDYESIATIDTPSTYTPHTSLKRFINSLDSDTPPKAKKNYTQELAEVNAKLDKILRLLEVI